MNKNDFEASLYGRPATVKTKLSLFRNHVKPYMKTCDPPGNQLDRACKGWIQDGLSIGTIKGCLVLLAEYMKVTHGYIIDKRRINNAYFSTLAKPPAKLKVWTKEQVKRAIHTVESGDPELHKLIVVALNTGMRRGEIFGLKWADVDFINGTIDVVRSRDISSGETGPTKTRQVRVIQMADIVAKILEKSYTIGKEEDFVFPDYFDPNARLNELSLHANVPFITFHDLRHTFATTALEKGMSPKWVSSTLGHAKLTTTMDLYWQNFREKVDMESIYE